MDLEGCDSLFKMSASLSKMNAPKMEPRASSLVGGVSERSRRGSWQAGHIDTSLAESLRPRRNSLGASFSAGTLPQFDASRQTGAENADTSDTFFLRRKSSKGSDGSLGSAGRLSLTMTSLGDADRGLAVSLKQPDGALRMSSKPLGFSSDQGALERFKASENSWARVLHTKKCGTVSREEFYTVFDIYHAMDDAVCFSNTKYNKAHKITSGCKALDLVHTMKCRTASGVRQPDAKFSPLADFFLRIWPGLSDSEMQTLFSWAKHREAQKTAQLRSRGAKLPSKLFHAHEHSMN